MQALVTDRSMSRLAATKLLSAITPRAFVGPASPMRLREIPEPALPAPDWAIVHTKLCGLCGSDYKQVFMNGAFDNPMTGFISWPQVLGHEVVGVIDEVGPEADDLRVGERVVLNPWLSCTPRGLPACEWCRRGDLAPQLPARPRRARNPQWEQRHGDGRLCSARTGPPVSVDPDPR